MSQDRRSQGQGAPGRWALAWLGSLAGGLAASLVSARLSRWELPILWLALVVGVLASLAFFAHRLPGWLAAVAIAFTTSLNLFLYVAIEFQAQLGTPLTLEKLAPLLGTLGVVAAVPILSRRRRGRVSAVTYDISTDPLNALDAPPIHSASEPLLIYANEPLLQQWALLMAAATGALGVGLQVSILHHANSALLLVLGILLLFASVHLILAVARLVMSGPTLIISPEGITDNASLIVTGRGLLRWDEISRVGHMSERAPIGITYHSLRIFLNDGMWVRSRQPIWKRLLTTVIGGSSPHRLSIYQGLLDEHPETLALQISAYAQEHALTGRRNPRLNPRLPDDSAGSGGDIWRI